MITLTTYTNILRLTILQSCLEWGSSAISWLPPRDVDYCFILNNDVTQYERRVFYHFLRRHTTINGISLGKLCGLALPPEYVKILKGTNPCVYDYEPLVTDRPLTVKDVYRKQLWICYWRKILTEDDKRYIIKLHNDLEYAATQKEKVEQEYFQLAEQHIKH